MLRGLRGWLVVLAVGGERLHVWKTIGSENVDGFEYLEDASKILSRWIAVGDELLHGKLQASSSKLHFDGLSMCNTIRPKSLVLRISFHTSPCSVALFSRLSLRLQRSHTSSLRSSIQIPSLLTA